MSTKIREALLLFSHQIELTACVEAIRARTFTPFRVERIGIGPKNARARTIHLLESPEKPSAVLSLGSAGWLRKGAPPSTALWVREAKRLNEPRLRPTIALPRTQLETFGWYSTRLLTVDRPVMDRNRAYELAEQMDVDAVDMESWPILDVCVEREVPGAIVRVVSDIASADAAARYRERIGDAMRVLGDNVAALLDWLHKREKVRSEKSKK